MIMADLWQTLENLRKSSDAGLVDAAQDVADELLRLGLVEAGVRFQAVSAGAPGQMFVFPLPSRATSRGSGGGNERPGLRYRARRG